MRNPREHEIADQLVAFLDGALTAEESREVERHLKGCPVCRETLDDFRRTEELLARWPDVEPSAGLKHRVLQSARASAPRPTRTRRFWSPAGSLQWAALAAGILLIAGTIYWVLPSFWGGDRLNDTEKSEIAANADLYMNLPVISHLETLEEMNGGTPETTQETTVRNFA